MIHIHKHSKTPVTAFDVMRTGGPNNVSEAIPQKFLVLWDVHAVKRSDGWHYIFDFDARETLQMSELAKIMRGTKGNLEYKNAVDWKKWLGDEWKLVNEQERWEILHPKDGSGQSDASISDIRMGRNASD